MTRTQERAGNAWGQRINAASRQMRTTIERLQWLVDFVQRDLSGLVGAGWRDVEDNLQAFALGGGYTIPAYSGTPSDPAPPGLRAEEIRDLQAETDRGCRDVLYGRQWVIPLRAIVRYVYQRRPAPRGRGRPTGLQFGRQVVGRYEGDLASRVLMAAADLLVVEGARLRVCQRSDCGHLFVRAKRQLYCGSSCAQRDRAERYRATHGETLRERRRSAYERKIKERLGPKVRVQRRTRQGGGSQPSGTR